MGALRTERRLAKVASIPLDSFPGDEGESAALLDSRPRGINDGAARPGLKSSSSALTQLPACAEVQANQEEAGRLGEGG